MQALMMLLLLLLLLLLLPVVCDALLNFFSRAHKQGTECEIVILSLCRTQSVGAFVESAFRVNVALTRGWRHLWVCGHGQLLQRSGVWKE